MKYNNFPSSKISLRLSVLSLLLVCSLSSSHSQGWRKQHLPVADSTAKIIQFVDSLNGWIYCEKSYFVTTNGGENWLRFQYPDDKFLVDARLLRNEYCLLVGADRNSEVFSVEPVFYWTSDNGKNWEKVFSSRSSFGIISSCIINRYKFAIIGAYYAKYFNWVIDIGQGRIDSTELPFGHPFPVGNWAYRDMSFKDSLTGYITAGQGLGPGMLPWGLILKTTDGGRTWRDDTVMYRAMFEHVEFMDAKRGYIFGYQDFVYDEFRSLWTSTPKLRFTIDSGKTWRSVIHAPPIRGFFLDDSSFFFVSRRWRAGYPCGYLYLSNVHIPLATKLLIDDSLIVDCSYVAPDHKWALRYDGRTVYKWDPLLSSGEQILDVKSFPLPKLYPNPATDRTQIDFTLPEEATVVISLYDLFSRRIKVIYDRRFDAGNHLLEVNCRGLPSGMYLCDVQITTEKKVTKRNWLKLSIFSQ